ncbi:hypothetical protein AJ79_01404 [Helicocarpus griseus UAMH5409]|uniref:Life-span regulatory factor domain-containing protein n=1 Tax=Helicocarpus griseus UAMH5409 TaxID=1447875 RepID=A0A2B7Y743_9EURO|nr:hypothetical protein AJ79_01404 [Helicocarpus griseus UAMH5409]
MATAWSLDFCLVCDRQTLGGAYCSQACRLAEMDGSGSDSEPSSPTTATSFQNPWASQRVDTASGLQLGPAIDFTTYKSSHQIPSNNSYPYSSRQGLSPSSSQTSLSSLNSVSSSSSTLSGQARSELEDYSGSFDKVRDWKRRLTAS